MWNFTSSVQLDSSRESVANEWDVELNAGGEIPYLQATIYYFVYHINTIALWLQEKPTSSMSEHKRIEIVRCVSAKAQDGKMRWVIITKTTMGVIFNLQNSPILNNNTNNSTRYILTLLWFRVLVFFPFWESLSVTVCERYGFFSVLAAIIQETSDKLPWIENREGFTVHSSTEAEWLKGEWRSSSWLAVSNTSY